MKSIKSKFIRGLALMLALIFVLNVPVSAFATTESDSEPTLVSDGDIATYANVNMTKAQMMDTAAFRALKYLGYDRDGKLEKAGNLFDLTGSNVAEEYRTSIGYPNEEQANYASGLQTSGKNTGYTSVTSAVKPATYPNVSKFEETCLDCVDYAAYYLTNYLRNIEGCNLSWLDSILTKYKAIDKYYAYDNMYFWSEARTDLIKAGVNVYHATAFSTSTFTGSDGTVYEKKAITKYTAYEKGDTKGYSVNNSATDVYSLLKPGDLIQMGKGSNENIHYAIYAGTYNGKHYMYHCGNSRGPEINIIENMWTYMAGKSKQSVPLYFYHFEWPENYGSVTVKKTGSDGKNLAGAKFLLTYEDGRYWELETDKNGSASVEDIPLGKYTIRETVSPQGYVLDSTVKTFTLTKDTATFTYSLTNALATGSIKVKKYTDSGGKLTGAVFGVYNTETKERTYVYDADSGSVTFTDPYTQKSATAKADGKANGWVTFSGLPLGTYIVYEAMSPAAYVRTTNTYTVELTKNGQKVCLCQKGDKATQESENWTVTVTEAFSNRLAVGNIAVKKYDQEGNTLTGAVFGAYNAATGQRLYVYSTGC